MRQFNNVFLKKPRRRTQRDRKASRLISVLIRCSIVVATATYQTHLYAVYGLRSYLALPPITFVLFVLGIIDYWSVRLFAKNADIFSGGYSPNLYLLVSLKSAIVYTFGVAAVAYTVNMAFQYVKAMSFPMLLFTFKIENFRLLTIAVFTLALTLFIFSGVGSPIRVMKQILPRSHASLKRNDLAMQPNDAISPMYALFDRNSLNGKEMIDQLGILSILTMLFGMLGWFFSLSYELNTLMWIIPPISILNIIAMAFLYIRWNRIVGLKWLWVKRIYGVFLYIEPFIIFLSIFLIG